MLKFLAKFSKAEIKYVNTTYAISWLITIYTCITFRFMLKAERGCQFFDLERQRVFISAFAGWSKSRILGLLLIGQFSPMSDYPDCTFWASLKYQWVLFRDWQGSLFSKNRNKQSRFRWHCIFSQNFGLSGLKHQTMQQVAFVYLYHGARPRNNLVRSVCVHRL